MKKDLFENIGDKLNQYDSPLDLNAEWNAVSNRQKEGKRKRMILLGSLLLATLISVVGYFSFGNLAEESPLLPKQDQTSVKQLPLADLNSETLDLPSEKLVEEVEFLNKSKEKEIAVVSEVLFAKKQLNQQEDLSTIPDFVESNPTVFKNNQMKTVSPTLETDLEKPALLGALLELELGKINLLSQQIDKIELPEITEISLNGEKATKRKIQLFFNGGLAMTGQKFEAKDNANEAYAQLRSASEMALETYSYEAGANFFINKKSFIRAAADYNIGFDQINYQYNSPKSFEFENVVLRRIIYPNGDVEEIFGDTTLLGTQTITETQFNKYTSVNLSISFGHVLLEKGRFSLAAMAGLTQNISLKSEGKIISSDNSNAPLKMIDGYKKSYDLGLSGGIDLDYQLTNKMKLNIRPSGAYSLSSATKTENLLDSKFYRVGFSAGVKFDL